MTASPELHELEDRLNHFDPQVRAISLTALVELAEQGQVALEPARNVANMHCHSFFSYNAYGHSPSSLAWLAKRRGIKLMGIVDFDVLDGVDEFLDACDLVGVRGSTGMETRLYLPEFSTRETNSPGEPGIYYHMGIGFTTSRVPDSAAAILEGLGRRSDQRNRQVVARLNDHLRPVIVDYEREILPLAPGGTPTERHIVLAYTQAAAEQVSDQVSYWASRLEVPSDEVRTAMSDGPGFRNLVRAKLIKRGGIAYVQPTPEMFPTVEPFHEFVRACRALPCATWLDGLSTGEQAMKELLELLIGKGAVALNIVPDRNWNVPDPELRRVKIKNLYEVVDLAGQLALPLNVGTEMNTYGQKFVDDFEAAELAPVRKAFIDGAHFIYGHTVLERRLRLGYQSDWAQAHLPARRARNDFYTEIGYRVSPNQTGWSRIEGLNAEMAPEEILARLDQTPGM